MFEPARREKRVVLGFMVDGWIAIFVMELEVMVECDGGI